YINNALPVSLTFTATRRPSSERVIADREYYQRKTELGVKGSLELPAPNSLTVDHTFVAGAEYRRLEPLNRDDFLNDGLPSDYIPTDAELLELALAYEFSTEYV